MGKGIKNVLGIRYYWPAGSVTSHCTPQIHHRYTSLRCDFSHSVRRALKHHRELQYHVSNWHKMGRTGDVLALGQHARKPCSAEGVTLQTVSRVGVLGP